MYRFAYLMCQRKRIVADGAFYTADREPPGQASVYIPPGDTRKEEYRLATFKDFPKNSPVQPTDLASSGFHYVGYKDRVKCFCCGSTVETWVIGDNPRDLKWHKTECDFSNQRDTQNIPMAMRTSNGIFRRFLLEAVTSTQQKLPISGQHLSTTAHQHPIRSSNTREYPECQHPVNPHMRSLAARIESFQARSGNRWPAHQLRATVNELAVAGFYCLGQRDRVKCWYCNGGIQNWEYDDDPWIEHAKWFPGCEFVRTVKGYAFIRQVTTQHSGIERPVPTPPAAPSGNNTQHVSTIASNASSENHVMMTIQNALPRLNYVTKAKEMGINIDVITDVLLRKYRQDGNFFHGDADFFEALFSARSQHEELHSSRRQSNEIDRDRQYQQQSERQDIATQPRRPSVTTMKTTDTENNGDLELASQLRSLTESRLCKVCKTNVSNVVTIPCGHICMCDNCASKMSKCPSCLTSISKIIKAYRA